MSYGAKWSNIGIPFFRILDLKNSIKETGVLFIRGAYITLEGKARTITYTFSHLADDFIQSDVQRREQSSYEQ